MVRVLKQSLAASLRRSNEDAEPVIGLFVKLPALETCEMVARAGFDFVVIDMEHALLSVRDVYGMIVTYSNLGVAPLVRVPDHGHGDAQRCLDAGAAGILVPHVTDATSARRVVQQLIFPPEGTRGQGTASRAGRWGRLPGGTAEYLASGRDDVVRMVMIEDAEGLENVGSILKTQGLSGVFVGPGDLTLSMGQPPGSEAVQSAIDQVIGEAVRASVPVGTVVSTGEQARRRADQGCSFLLFGNDAGIFARSVAEVERSARDALRRPDAPPAAEGGQEVRSNG